MLTSYPENPPHSSAFIFSSSVGLAYDHAFREHAAATKLTDGPCFSSMRLEPLLVRPSLPILLTGNLRVLREA